MKSVEPIRKESDIARIKKYLHSTSKYDYFYFILGINSGIRSGDLLNLKMKDFINKKIGDTIEIKETKTGKKNYIIVNRPIKKAFDVYMETVDLKDEDYIFYSTKKGKQTPINIFSMSRKISGWMKDLGIKGNFGCHSLRKTWGYHQRVKYQVGFDVICKRFNHSNPAITMRYLGITSDEINQTLVRFK